jgi:hypothetical protein
MKRHDRAYPLRERFKREYERLGEEAWEKQDVAALGRVVSGPTQAARASSKTRARLLDTRAVSDTCRGWPDHRDVFLSEFH